MSLISAVKMKYFVVLDGGGGGRDGAGLWQNVTMISNRESRNSKVSLLNAA